MRKSTRESDEPEQVLDFLATQRKSIFVRQSEVKKIVPSSHIMKMPHASIGNLDVSAGDIPKYGRKNRSTGDPEAKQNTKDMKTKGKRDKSSESEGDSPRSRKSGKSEIIRKSTLVAKASKSPDKVKKLQTAKSGKSPKPADDTSGQPTKLSGKTGFPAQGEHESDSGGKKSDDKSSERKNSDDESDRRKNSDDNSDGRKNSNDNSDVRKNSEDKSDGRKNSDEKPDNKKRDSEKTGKNGDKLADGRKKSDDDDGTKKKSGNPKTGYKTPVKTDDDIAEDEKSGEDDTGSKKKKGKKDKKGKNKDKKDKKDTKKEKGRRSKTDSEIEAEERESEDLQSEQPVRRDPFPEQSPEDDETFQWLLDEESAKMPKFTSYAVEDLLRDMPEHQWLLVPSIKWSLMRESKEKQRNQSLLDAEEAARLAELAAEFQGEIEEEAELEIVSLFQRPLDPCHPNPCSCKDRKRPPVLSCCTESSPVQKTASEQCWEDYLAREQKDRRMRWFTCVLVSAHTRRPKWIPPPEEYLRQQHQALQALPPPPPEEVSDMDAGQGEHVADSVDLDQPVVPEAAAATPNKTKQKTGGANGRASQDKLNNVQKKRVSYHIKKNSQR